MMIFKKAIPRRTFIRGVGAAVALPLLDAMVPALSGAGTPAPGRLAVVYVPNGIVMDKFTPATEGAGFEITPILEPLAAYKKDMLVLSGLSNEKAAEIRPGENGAPHARAGTSFLTGARPAPSEGAEIHAGVSMDQIAAKELGKQTQLASMELSLEASEFVGACESGFSCAYMNTLSWRTPTTPIPNESNPRVVFERMFGDSDSTDPAERLRRNRRNGSILDAVRFDVQRLQKSLGLADQVKLTEWEEAIRDLERRIQIAEQQSTRELPTLDRPAGIPEQYEEHARIMFDLQVLAFQSDLTRVITFMLAREASARIYTEIGIAEQHHPLTHHRNDSAKISRVFEINRYHTKVFSYFLDRLRSTPDGNGTLLDNLMLLYGSGISDGNKHYRNNLPVLLFGKGAGKIKQNGLHVRYRDETPMANLYLTMLGNLGISLDSLGDSTGALTLPGAA